MQALENDVNVRLRTEDRASEALASPREQATAAVSIWLPFKRIWARGADPRRMWMCMVSNAGMDVIIGARQCWCGSRCLDPWSPSYLLCPRCQTLVGIDLPPPDYYSSKYWFSHQSSDLGLPDIHARSRKDLIERCLFWLRAIQRHCPSGARILEIGSGHGAFLGVLQYAGYSVVGLEPSEEVAALSSSMFGVDVRSGRIEAQRFEPASFDAILLFDVLEHLDDPLGAMREVRLILRPNGLVFVQTPQYPENRSLEDLRSSGHRFTEMLIPREHLFLFSQRSARSLMHRIGLMEVSFLDAIFSHYDMFFVAGSESLPEFDATAVDGSLARTPSGRIVRGLLDLRADLDSMQAAYRSLEAEAGSLRQQVAQLSEWLLNAQRREKEVNEAAASLRQELDAIKLSLDATHTDEGMSDAI